GRISRNTSQSLSMIRGCSRRTDSMCMQFQAPVAPDVSWQRRELRRLDRRDSAERITPCALVVLTYRIAVIMLWPATGSIAMESALRSATATLGRRRHYQTPESAPGDSTAPELTILMPCLNEAETVATCVYNAHAFLKRTGIAGEVVVADNGSSDGSAEIARNAGAR